MNKKWLDECLKVWKSLPEEIQNSLKQAFEESQNLEQFISKEMIGECPKCGSENTIDCENIQGIEDNTICLCKDCGYLWCICGAPVSDDIECGHWKICEECKEEKDEFGDCGILPEECEHIKRWVKSWQKSKKKKT